MFMKGGDNFYPIVFLLQKNKLTENHPTPICGLLHKIPTIKTINTLTPFTGKRIVSNFQYNPFIPDLDTVLNDVRN
jgi:hypothetical protein